jgi:quercetin dioxygenase-like cupin family protein
MNVPHAELKRIYAEQKEWTARVRSKASTMHEREDLRSDHWEFSDQWEWFMHKPDCGLKVRKVDIGVNSRIVSVAAIATEDTNFGPHWHTSHEEVMVIRGGGFIVINGIPHPVGTGSYISIPAGDMHSGFYRRGTLVILLFTELGDIDPGEVSSRVENIGPLISSTVMHNAA